MNSKDIIEFFDKLSETWDADMIRDDRIIDEILKCGDVAKGKRILDVACGTGVLFPDYIERGVESVTGVDISPKMAEIARGKYPEKKCKDTFIEVICGDICETSFDKNFDCVMIYNAFPHFPSPEKLFESLAKVMNKDSRITVAHGMSREKIDAHHKGRASKVSMGLMHENELAKLMGKFFKVDTIISDDEKYIVSGIK